MKDLKRIDGTWLKEARDTLTRSTDLEVTSETSRFSTLFASHNPRRTKARNTYHLNVGTFEYIVIWGFDLTRGPCPLLTVHKVTNSGTHMLARYSYPHYDHKDTYYAPAPHLQIVTPIMRDLLQHRAVPVTVSTLLDAGLASADIVHLQRTKEGVERKLQALLSTY